MNSQEYQIWVDNRLNPDTAVKLGEVSVDESMQPEAAEDSEPQVALIGI